jgi:hypothetical protein
MCRCYEVRCIQNWILRSGTLNGKKFPEDDLGKIDTCRNFDGLYAKLYIFFKIYCIFWYYSVKIKHFDNCSLYLGFSNFTVFSAVT